MPCANQLKTIYDRHECEPGIVKKIFSLGKPLLADLFFMTGKLLEMSQLRYSLVSQPTSLHLVL